MWCYFLHWVRKCYDSNCNETKHASIHINTMTITMLCYVRTTRYDNIDKTFIGKCSTAFVIARRMIAQTWLQFSNLHCELAICIGINLMWYLICLQIIKIIFNLWLKMKLIDEVSLKMSFSIWLIGVFNLPEIFLSLKD